jgi:MFS family permease
MTISTVSGMAGIFVLALATGSSQPWMLYFYAMALGFGFGLATPTLGASTTDIFQGPKVGAIIGSVWLSFAIGGFIGPWLGGWIFESTRSYLIAFVVAMVFYLIGCVALWCAAPRKARLMAGRPGSP